MYRRCVIITAWLESKIADVVTISADDFIICADGGLEFAAADGIMPDAVIGDFDSLSRDPDAIIQSIRRNISSGGTDKNPEIIRLPREKDETDTISCVQYAIAKGISDFLIVGGLGGRFDHSIAIIQTLSFLLDM
ncbi:MAG: thiamine diphosphokinase, partial [Clostridiales Family XIII bacterium]|nr:thiamine diphosphokinase [Clostridiales Family XIII bacterium]